MQISTHLNNSHPGRVLDVGCGTGQFIEFLSETLGSFQLLTGVDVDRDALAKAKKKFPGERYEFMTGSGEKLPFRDEQFQLVSISKALHHMPDPARSIKEMIRVLEHEGMFLVQEMYRDGLSPAQESHKRYHHLRADLDRRQGINHHHTFNRADLLGLIDGVGLKEQAVEEIQPDDSMARDPSNQQEFIDKMYAWLDALQDHAIRDQYLSKVREVEKHILMHGISRPPMLMILGRKG